MTVLALLQSPGSVTLQALSNHGIENRSTLSIPSAIGLHRYDLDLYGGSEIIVRLPGGSRSPFIVSKDEGKTFHLIKPVPGNGPLSPQKSRVHSNGSLTVIDGSTLWIYPQTLKLWVNRELPDNFEICDVSFDRYGYLHLVGAVPSNRVLGATTEAAYALLDEEIDFLNISLSEREVKFLERSGGNEVFRQVDVENLPLVVTSDCAWQFEDASSFIVVNPSNRWRLKKLQDQSIRTWIREGGNAISVFTTEGNCYHTNDGGMSWDEHSFVSAICRAGESFQVHTPVVMAVTRSQNKLFLAVSAYDWGASLDKQLITSAVLVSSDNGQTFHSITKVENPEQEFLALLPI